jgi:Flp pilus assembly protein TadB
MSKRNVAWLVVMIGVGVLVWITAGLLWGLLAAAVTLIGSELIERTRRKKLRAARGETGSPSLTDAVKARRKRR